MKKLTLTLSLCSPPALEDSNNTAAPPPPSKTQFVNIAVVSKIAKDPPSPTEGRTVQTLNVVPCDGQLPGASIFIGAADHYSSKVPLVRHGLYGR